MTNQIAIRKQPSPVSVMLAMRLHSDGFVKVPLASNGARLFIIRGSLVGEPKTTLLISMEGGGGIAWDGKRALNAFRLIEAGFDITVAATLAAKVNEAYSILTQIEARETDRKSKFKSKRDRP